MIQASHPGPVPTTQVEDWSKVVIVGPYSQGDTLKPGERVASLPKELGSTFAWDLPGEEIIIARTGDLVVVVDSTKRA